MYEITYADGSVAIVTSNELQAIWAYGPAWLIVTRAYYEFPMLPLLNAVVEVTSA